MGNKSDDDDYIPCDDVDDYDYDDSVVLYNNKNKKRKISNVFPITLCLMNFNEEEKSTNKEFSEDEKSTDREFSEDEEEINYLHNMRNQIDIINKKYSSNYNIEDQVLLSNLDIKTKANIISKIKQCNDKYDKNKLHTWIHEILRLPIGVYIDPFCSVKNFDFNNFLLTARRKLDKAIYGMENTKEEIIDFLIKLVLNNKNSGTVLGLKGPKGVGKTKLCRALSDILNLPLFQISMGGLTDSSILLGHDSTYIGSKCGRIAKIIQEAKCMNFILYIDELDKSGSEGNAKEVQGVLTHLLDETQNTHFQDLYFDGIDLDLSRVLFITSFNESENVDPIVLNRMKVLDIKELSIDDKVNIVQNFILPEINYNKFNINNDIIRYIINNKTTPEPGMRNIKKNIETIVNRLNTYKILSVCENSKDITKKFSYNELKIKTDNNNNYIINENVIDVLLSKEKTNENWRNMYI